MCAKNDYKCEELANKNDLPNGCSLNKPYRCSHKEGDCAVDLDKCDFATECPEDKPVLCADKTCAVNKTVCK